ncbi:MAG: hypothetical protein IJS15_11480, partial [Victivallales bacterium]|nr:hypothetical protein [Victivallales bacterium]
MLKLRHLLVLCLAVVAAAFASPWSENERQALNEAIRDAKQDIAAKGAPLRDRNILLLPFRGDNDSYFFKNMKAALLESGLRVIEEENSKEFQAMADLFKWDDCMKDLIMPQDLLKFGNLRGAQVIFYGRIREISSSKERVYAEIELFASQIETREVLWGGIFAGRYFAGGNIIGRFSEDIDIVNGINESFKLFDKALKESANLERIKSKKIAILSLA